MSIKKWHQLAEEKSAIDQQTEEIHQKFRMNEIKKEFGQLSGEELFKPITKRLDEKSSTTAEEEEEQEVPDEFRSDAPPPPAYQEFDDLPPPPLMEETVMPGTSKGETREETKKRLKNVKSLITKHKDDPTYRITSKKSKYYGYNVEKLKEEEYKLETIKANQEQAERLLKRTQSLSEQLQEGRKKLKPPEKPEKREITKTPIEKAVMSRRPYLEPSDNDWGETEGSGIADEA